MYSAKLYYISNVKLIYCLYSNRITYDSWNGQSNMKPDFLYGSKLFKQEMLEEFISLLDKRLNKNPGFSTYFESPYIYFILFGSYNAVIWNNTSSRDDFYLTICSDDLLFGDKLEDISKLIVNNTFLITKEYFLHLERLFVTYKDKINKEVNSIIFLPISDIHYIAWLSKRGLETSYLFKDYFFLGNDRHNIWANGDGLLNNIRYFYAKCPIISNKCFVRPKIVSFSKLEKFTIDFYEHDGLNKTFEFYPNLNSDFGMNYNNYKYLTLGDSNRNNSLKEHFHLGLPKPMHIRYLLPDHAKNVNSNVNLGKAVLNSLIDINYFSYAYLILYAGLFAKYEDKVLYSGSDVVLNITVDELDKVYSLCKKNDIILPIIFSNTNNDITLYSLVNLFCYMLKDPNICSTGNLSYHDSEVLCQGNHESGYTSNYDEDKPRKDCNNEIAQYLSDFQNYADRFVKLYPDVVNPIFEFGYNKVEELSALLLNFIIDNEIDNYFEWNLYLMDNKIRDIVLVINALIKFKDKFNIKGKSYIALEYLIGLTLSILKQNHTINDMYRNIYEIELEEFYNYYTSNYNDFSRFEVNFILILTNIYLTDLLKKNYLEV